MTHRLGLDEGTLHDLRQELHAPSAVSRAAIPEFHQRYLRALHTDTHFQLGTQSDHVRTLAGTRPGDSFADVVFGYLWSRVLQVLQEQLLAYGLLTTYPRLLFAFGQIRQRQLKPVRALLQASSWIYAVSMV